MQALEQTRLLSVQGQMLLPSSSGCPATKIRPRSNKVSPECAFQRLFTRHTMSLMSFWLYSNHNAATNQAQRISNRGVGRRNLVRNAFRAGVFRRQALIAHNSFPPSLFACCIGKHALHACGSLHPLCACNSLRQQDNKTPCHSQEPLANQQAMLSLCKVIIPTVRF